MEGQAGGGGGGGDSRWVLLLSNDKEMKAAKQSLRNCTSTLCLETAVHTLYLIVILIFTGTLFCMQRSCPKNRNKISPSKLGRKSGTAISGTLPMSGT